jgi:hypothetical protein
MNFMSAVASPALERRPDEIISSSKKRPAPQRDARLDFWRALCLIDMILVHLIYDGVNFGPIQKTIGEYTRFAAGGFVFVAGLSIGAIFLPRTFSKDGRQKTYLALWRRAFYILCINFVATLSFVALDLIRGMRADFPGLLPVIRNILTFREGGDLLLLYVIVVAASPMMLELLRRKLWWVLAGISLFLFYCGQNHPWLFSSPIHENFPVLLWQAVFTAGALFGGVLPKYTALSRRTKLILAITAWAISIVLWAGDFRSDFGWPYPVLPLAFVKTPLSNGEALRYFGLIFAIIFTTDLFWNRIANSRLVSLANTMGRRSLAVFVAHVWVYQLIGYFCWYHKSWGAWQMLLAIPAVVACWAVARILDWNQKRPALVLRLPTSRWIPIPLGTAAAALMVVIVAQISPPIPPTTITVTPAAVPGTSRTQPHWTDDGSDTDTTPTDIPTWNGLPVADTDIIHA